MCCRRIVFADVLKKPSKLRIQLFNQFFVVLKSTGIFAGLLCNKNSLPRITTFGRSSFAERSLATLDESPNANGNVLHAIVAHICT